MMHEREILARSAGRNGRPRRTGERLFSRAAALLLRTLSSAALVLTLPWRIGDRARDKRRERLSTQPFPHTWSELLEKKVPLFRLMPPELQAQLKGRILVFLAEKRFEGCAGQEINDEVRITIAAHACMLLLNRSAGSCAP